MIKIKSKFIPPQPRNKKYLGVNASGTAISSYVSGGPSSPVEGIVAIPYSDKDYDVD